MNKEYDIRPIAEKLGLKEENLILFGNDKAKIDTSTLANNLKRKGKLILCTAITPTKAGEGKTTTAIGLADGMASIGMNAMACLREPSLGPVFGVKGGGAGGGEATLYPEDDINLHFTGDMHAITSANNLIAALIDNELFQGSELNVDPERIIFPRCMDMNDRSLRDITTCMNDKKGIPHHSSFVITAASELMACFCLSNNEEEFLDRVENITVAYSKDGKEIKVRQLECRKAIQMLMHVALYPNLVQTKYHTPALVHGGPFANIAHGTNSIIATDLALKLSDYVLTESGFGSDLGMEKYMDIVSPIASYHPDLVVLVCSIRALKLHGGVPFDMLKDENVEATSTGLDNLMHHIQNVKAFGVPLVVGINQFKDDTPAEIETLVSFLRKQNIPYALNTSYADGPEGSKELAKVVKKTLEESECHYAPIVNNTMTLEEKISVIAKTMYGAKDVEYSPDALKELREYERGDYSNFNICVSKVPNSLSDDPHLLNVPKDHTLHIKKLRLFTGAGFVVPLTGDVFTMPGLPKVPASKKMN
jgi:formate--tetrahydrofolate ligase